MGCDIHGMVEVREYPDSPNWWTSVINAGNILGRSYDLFGMLFGVRNCVKFEAIADNRGVPSHPSIEVEEVYKENEGEYHYHSWNWLSYKEIKNIPLEEESEEFDERVHEFKKDEEGEWQNTGHKSGWSSRIDYEKLEKEGGMYVDGDIMFKRVKMKRKDCLNSDWDFLVSLMDILANKYGEDNVRLIVWFDN